MDKARGKGKVTVHNYGSGVRADAEVQSDGDVAVRIVDTAVKAARTDFQNQMSSGYDSYPRTLAQTTTTRRR